MRNLTAIRDKIGALQIFVIDEVSIVSTDTLLTLHRRLVDLKGCKELFGGISILAVEDLLQLPPVASKPVFANPTDKLSAIYGSIWTAHLTY